jgi:hypothetical protein
MTLIHGYLLAGLVLAGLPIIVHLVMRQKPRQLPFPAFRFLKRRLHVNQRRMRLQHLLLLALRIGLIAALCLALVEPKVRTSAAPGKVDQPVAAVFLIDTSPSMEYKDGDEMRLTVACGLAEKVLDQMDPRSRVAVLDCGDDPKTDTDQATEITKARARVKSLTTRPASYPVNAHIARAYGILESLGAKDPTAPRLLYIFSDRTRNAWSDALKTEELPPYVRAVFVDVGVDEPHDLAIDRIEVVPAVADPGQEVQVSITVRCTGRQRKNRLSWQIDNDPNAEQQPSATDFELAGGKERTFAYKIPKAPPLPPQTRTAAFQITARLALPDSLTFNDTRSATFLVRNRRTVLTIADDPKAAQNWHNVFAAIEKSASERGEPRPLHATFKCEVVSTESTKDWQAVPDSAIVCLYQTRNPPQKLWGMLHDYVSRGGKLIIVPGGDEVQDDDVAKFNSDGVKAELLPAKLVRFRDVSGPKKDGKALLKDFDRKHPLTAPFEGWRRANVDFTQEKLRPFFTHLWEVAPVENTGQVIMSYEKPDQPALLERDLGPSGRVLMFTIPLDNHEPDKVHPRTNIWSESSFGMVLVDLACVYLAGGTETGEVNFVCGKPVLVPLLTSSDEKEYQLKGPPGLTLSETKVPAPEGRLLAIPQATQPGNYSVVREKGDTVAAFSVNIPAEESRLERVPGKEIERALGGWYNLTDRALAALRSAEVPNEVLAKLDDLREKELQAGPFSSELAQRLDKNELERFEGVIRKQTATSDVTLLSPGEAPRLADSVSGGRPGQRDLMPWLLLAVLLVLGVESVLANKFYRRESKAPEAAVGSDAIHRVAATAEPAAAGTTARAG